MSDETELQTDASATHGLSSTEGAVHERVVMLAVNTVTGEVDYDYLQYDLRSAEEANHGYHALIDGWEFKPFKIVPAT